MAAQFVSSETSVLQPILLIDKVGFWGERLATILKDFSQVVLVSPEENTMSTNPLFVKFHENIPQIPSDSYSHIIIFWDGDGFTKLLVDASLEKAKTDDARFVIFFDQRTWNADVARFVRERGGIVGVLPDVYGSGSTNKTLAPLDHLIHEAKKKNHVELTNMGLTIRIPLSYTQTIKAILTLVFGEDKPVQTQLLYPAIPLTELGFSHALKKIDPEIGVTFQPKSEEVIHIDIPGNYVLSSISDPLADLPDVFAHTEVTKEEIEAFEAQVRQMQPPKIVKQIQKQKPIGKWLGLTFGETLLAGLVIPGLCLVVGLSLLWSAKSLVLSGQLSQGIRRISQAVQVLHWYDKTSEPLTQLLTWGIPSAIPQMQLITQGEQLGINAIDMLTIAHTLNTQDGYATSDIPFLGALVRQSLQIVLATNVVDIPSLGISPQDLNTGMTLVQLAPVMIPQQGTKRYLVLFQNNAELRPGGGFIGSYAIVTFINGKMDKLEVKDVYDADGQLKGHIEPPFFYRRYLQQPHLFLRDSNYAFDFPANAQLAESMLQDETGDRVDGVIGLDLYVVKGMLSSLGALYLPEFQETVTADTFFQQAESHAQDNFFPGSTQKKDYLGSVMSRLMNMMGDPKNLPQIVGMALHLLEEKHIQLYTNDQSALNVLTAAHLSGSVWDGRHTGATMLNDTLSVSEANVGVNKSNKGITRSLDQVLIASPDGKLADTVTLSIKNANTIGDKLGGPYVSYVRFLVPNGALLQKIRINGNDAHVVLAVTDPKMYESKTFKPDPSVLEVAQIQEYGKKTIGFLVTVPEQATQRIEVTYQLPFMLDAKQSLVTYSQQLIKQSGIDQIPYTLRTQLPSTFRVLTNEFGKSSSDGNMSFSQNTTTDMQIQFTIARR